MIIGDLGHDKRKYPLEYFLFLIGFCDVNQ